MSLNLGQMPLILEKRPQKLRSSHLYSSSYRQRASSSINSPRNQSSPSTLTPRDRPLHPYQGLSIGLMKLEKRSGSKGSSPHKPTVYSHYFSDVYLNSETISFPKVETFKFAEDSGAKIDFFRPYRLDFRRLKKKSWSEHKNTESTIVAINSGQCRSAGKAYENGTKKKKELLPVTRYRARRLNTDGLGLKIRGILKSFK